MHALKWPINSARIVPVGVGFVDDPDPHLRGDLGARVDDEDLAVWRVRVQLIGHL